MPTMALRIVEKLRLAPAAALALTLLACGPGSLDVPEVSLDEAKKITAAFAGSFTPPPKSINDVVAAVPESFPSAPDCAAATTLSDDSIRALMQSLPPFEPNVRRSNRSSFAEGQAELHFLRGNFRRSVKYMEWAIQAIPPDLLGAFAIRYATLAAYHAHAGDVAAAERALGQSGGYGAGMRSGIPDANNRAWFQYRVGEGRAAVAESKGDLTQAEAYYREAIQAARQATTAIGESLDLTRLMLARNLMRQGRLLETENEVRGVLRYRMRYQSPSVVTAMALLRFGEVLYEQGRYGEAETVARLSERVFRVACTEPGNLNLAAAHNLRAMSLIAQDRAREALDAFEAIRNDMAGDPDLYQRLFAGNSYRALALLRAGRADEAAQDLRLAFERSRDRFGDKHYRTAEAQGFLAMAELAQGKRAEALRTFATATQSLLQRSRHADEEGSAFAAGDRRLNLILGAYIGLLADVRGGALAATAGVEPVAESFRLAEVARSRSVDRALSASGARARFPNPDLARFARQEQDAQKKIAALHGTLAEMLARPPGEQNREAIAETKTIIDRLRGARTALTEEIEKRFPEYARLVNPRPMTLDEARATLRPGETLLATFVGEAHTYVWAVPHAGPAAFAAVAVKEDELAGAIGLLRSALEPNAATVGDIPPFDLKTAHGLYRTLLDPVRTAWRDARSLLVVAHGPLGYLPISVLPMDPAPLEPEGTVLFANYRSVPWLARRYAVTLLPSVASLGTLRALPPGDPARRPFVGFGDPWFSEEQAAISTPEDVEGTPGVVVRGLPLRRRNLQRTDAFDSAQLARLPRLPDTADEVRSIALALAADPARDLFLGREANEARAKSMDLSGFKVLAFATHGLVPGDLDGLREPALALSAPDVAGTPGEDGVLTMGEILGLKLNADWVVLSACNTSSGAGAGAEAVSGLGRAFFYAGSRALLVSNWPVHSASAKDLTTDLFRRQAADESLGRAEALRQAMLAMIDGGGVKDSAGRTLFAYAHPLFWAPFSLVGDPGGSAPGS